MFLSVVATWSVSMCEAVVCRWKTLRLVLVQRWWCPVRTLVVCCSVSDLVLHSREISMHCLSVAVVFSVVLLLLLLLLFSSPWEHKLQQTLCCTVLTLMRTLTGDFCQCRRWIRVEVYQQLNWMYKKMLSAQLDKWRLSFEKHFMVMTM